MPDKPEQSLETSRKRIRFLAWHRGIQETDLILGRFVDHNLGTLSAADCQWFEALFMESDHDILEWIAGKVPTPKAYDTPLMDRIKTLDHMKK